MKISRSFRGYMKLGVENTAGHMDYREQLEYAAEYEPPYPVDPPYMRLRGKIHGPMTPWNMSAKNMRGKSVGLPTVFGLVLVWPCS
jgi:isopenicillin N synthase-like dioxygenase